VYIDVRKGAFSPQKTMISDAIGDDSVGAHNLASSVYTRWCRKHYSAWHIDLYKLRVPAMPFLSRDQRSGNCKREQYASAKEASKYFLFHDMFLIFLLFSAPSELGSNRIADLLSHFQCNDYETIPCGKISAPRARFAFC
jgi:hypothetical protein